MPAEAAGRQGRGVSQTPSSHAPVWGEYVFFVFKHHSNVI